MLHCWCCRNTKQCMLMPIVKFGEQEEVVYNKSYDLANM